MPAFDAKGHRILDCETCGHRFLAIEDPGSHIERVYDDSYFTGGGAGYLNYLLEEQMLRDRGRMYAAKVAEYIDEPGIILDIGAAAGCILKGFEDSGWSCVGLEPNAGMVKAGTDRYALDLRVGSLEQYETDERFDLISMIQVAGHFYDPRKAFENAARFLRPDGHLLIETWNRESMMARVFGTRWHEYSPPSVVQWWSLDGLTAFLEQMGFGKIADGRPSKKISGEHARSLLEYRLGKTVLPKLILKWLNIPYPSEDLFWGLYRKRE